MQVKIEKTESVNGSKYVFTISDKDTIKRVWKADTVRLSGCTLDQIVSHLTGYTICFTQIAADNYDLKVGDDDCECLINVADYDFTNVNSLGNLIKDSVNKVNYVASLKSKISACTIDI